MEIMGRALIEKCKWKKMNDKTIDKCESTCKGTSVVTIENEIDIVGVGVLPVKVQADFKDIPHCYHEMFLKVLMREYVNRNKDD